MTLLKGTFFVTGTDTDIGKTWVSCRMLENATDNGLSCYGLKPVAAGCEKTEQGWHNEDALALMQSASEKLSYEMVNPVALKEPMAPHLAAKLDGRTVRLSQLEGYVRGALMSRRADLVLIEAAGGWRVPLNNTEMLSGLAVRMKLPVILVVGMRLGCVSHALLSAEAICADGCHLAGWIANDLGRPMLALEENISTLEQLMPAPRLTISD